MEMPRNPVTPEPFFKQQKAETKDNPNISWHSSPEMRGGFGPRKEQAPLILRIGPSSDQLPLLSSSSTEGDAHLPLCSLERMIPFSVLAQQVRVGVHLGHPWKAFSWSPTPVPPMLYLLWLFSLPDLLHHNTLHTYFHNLADPGIHPALTLKSGSQDKHQKLS